MPDIWLITHQGLMAAVSGTSFAPAGPVTAREALTALSKLFDPATRPARPAGGALRWAVTTHVVRHPRSFSGGDPLTQAHLIAWAVRALGLAGARAPTPRHTGAVTLYADEVAIARSHHLVAGGTRAPSSLTAPATRGDLAAILLRCERALALRRAGAPPWFAWDLRLGPAGATELLAGSVRAAAVGLPATGVIRGGTLRSSDGMLKETWIVSQGLEGVGHIVSLSGHRRRRVTFAWQTDPVLPAGAIWEYPPAGGVNPTVYLGAGTVRVEGLPAPVRIRSARAGEAVSTCLRACGPRSATLTYRGPSFAFVPILEMERFLLARR